MRVVLLAVATTAAAFAFASVALAYAWNDLNDFNLTETTSTYGGGTQFHISSGTDGWVSYRWLDSPVKTTIISANACTDGSYQGGSTYSASDTTYHALYNGGSSECFVVRGRTSSGSGSMSFYDGRIQR